MRKLFYFALLAFPLMLSCSSDDAEEGEGYFKGTSSVEKKPKYFSIFRGDLDGEDFLKTDTNGLTDMNACHAFLSFDDKHPTTPLELIMHCRTAEDSTYLCLYLNITHPEVYGMYAVTSAQTPSFRNMTDLTYDSWTMDGAAIEVQRAGQVPMWYTATEEWPLYVNIQQQELTASKTHIGKNGQVSTDYHYYVKGNVTGRLTRQYNQYDEFSWATHYANISATFEVLTTYTF